MRSMSKRDRTTLGGLVLAMIVGVGGSLGLAASCLGRDRARISEHERDLASNRLGRDRLTLFAEICDALDVVPVLVPKARAAEVRQMVEHSAGPSRVPAPVRPAFDELFVDLGDDEQPA